MADAEMKRKSKPIQIGNEFMAEKMKSSRKLPFCSVCKRELELGEFVYNLNSQYRTCESCHGSAELGEQDDLFPEIPDEEGVDEVEVS